MGSTAATIGRGAPPRIVDRGTLIALGLVASAPVVAALATWDPALGSQLLGKVRGFSLPVVAIEILVVIFALGRGFRSADALRNLAMWQRATLGIVCAIAIATALFVAPYRADALARTASSLIHLLFGFAVAHSLAGSGNTSRPLLWPGVALGISAYALLMPLYIAAIPDAADFDWLYLGLGVTNVRHVGYYAATGFAAALGVASIKERPAARWAWTAVAALAMLLASWSGSRGSVFAMMAAMVIAAAILPIMRTGRAIVSGLVAVTAGMIGSLVLPVPDPAYGLLRMSATLASNDLSTGRVALWLGTLDRIAERPVFGHGEGQFRFLVPEAVGVYNHPHDIFLQLAFQWGVVGLVCVLALAADLCRRGVIRARRAPAEGAPAVLVLAALLTYSLYDATGFYPYPVMMLAMSIACLLTSPASRPEPDAYRRGFAL